MLKSLSQYLFLQALGPFIVASIVLTGIIWLTQALRMLDVLITQGQTLVTFFELTALALPSTLVIVLPISLFCAILYTLHKLISDSEIVVMFSAGISRSVIATPFLVIALGTSALILLFSIYVAPAGLRELKSQLYEIRSDVATAMIREGTFANPAQGLTIYVRERASDGTTYGILVHDSRNPKEPITYMAETGSLVETPNGPLLVMFNGNIQRVSREGDREMGAATLLYFDKYTYDLSQYIDTEPSFSYEGRERYFSELINPARDDTYGQTHREKLLADAHERLVEGVYPTMLTLIALATLLPAPFNRRGYASRIALAATLALAIRLLGFVLANGASTSTYLIPLMYLVPFAVCGACIAIIAGVRFDFLFQRFRAAMPRGRA
ncbi:LPS export ABC transporter permease LptF [Parvibaculum sp.]|jgi:lipopolysaccharide export system permease protein|uniref:LPS export ABC transporter permease LptF n=1 Tax=Parvibaculum sp. TaxID=2024848 RepID=UPI000C3BE263|nr:LPS export ABC transporter permease LptF [Parvibaculum sp.]MAM96180.1 LPS export ABC transporter permease LptF [Parvibaculum sp.]HCX69283.1 LPS export ABC transporter permease LptF [Rhodobiaceae bacterium]|tara:strand:- start:8415 stop:9563 length:1149 start_codon:yes stop_codon:yes gene_type:complete